MDLKHDSFWALKLNLRTFAENTFAAMHRMRLADGSFVEPLRRPPWLMQAPAYAAGQATMGWPL